MSKTPSKNIESSNFTPRELTTPNKDSPGIAKTLFTHVSTLRGLLSDWTKVLDKGTNICKTISALKLYECESGYYPHQLKLLMENLLDLLDCLKNIINGVGVLKKQIDALAKLQPTNEPVIFTLPICQISDTVGEICSSIEKEYRLKEVVIENIAHCRNENLIEVYLSSWELEVYFSIDSVAYLFADVGLSGIT